MMKSALLLLGDSPSGRVAGIQARRLARTLGVQLTGLTGIDLAFIEAPMPGTIGGAAYHAQMESSLRTEAEKTSRGLDAAFRSDCAADGIVPTVISFEGDPPEQIALASATHDLVISGHDITFRGLKSESNSETLAQILSSTSRPVLVCPDEARSEGAVLVAYDGSLPAMRALQLFVLCGGWANRPVRVLSVHAELASAERLARDAASYLRLHGHEVDLQPVGSSEVPAEVIQAHAARPEIEVLVMGAYGHRGLKEFFFGSTTQTLIGQPKASIFLYH